MMGQMIKEDESTRNSVFVWLIKKRNSDKENKKEYYYLNERKQKLNKKWKNCMVS